ncbi:hypothetical protein [Celeribacter baekdonensis]|uniref:hypothetical protein n=1 Tax=Celeribacter baekdonensis TaxID=875171 RepID=UPI0026EB64BF|nr:hypothetical protein [Celeribacter baekdonensis]|tara:strand:+ start:9592 stop:10317 length:726 start_codon:yes stop_codon:yes gene_type:complete
MFGLDFSLTVSATKKPRSVTFLPTDLADLLGWYDPSDLTTLYQDAAMTIPVASSGDPVGAMLDKSGNGFHLVALSEAARPTLVDVSGSAALSFDGIDDNLSAIAPFLSPQPNTIACKLMMRGIGSKLYNDIILGSADNGITTLEATDILGIYAGQKISSSNFPLLVNQPFDVVGVYNAASSNIYAEGALVASGNVGTAGLGTLQLGGILSASRYAQFDFFGGAIVGGLLTEAERNSLRAVI